MESSLDFIEGHSGLQRDLLAYLYTLIVQTEQLQPRMVYGLPFFYGNRWVCYLRPLSDGGVELGFTHGSELSDQCGLLESKGRKQVMSVTFHALTDLPENALVETLEKAVRLDLNRPISKRRNPG